MPRLSWTSKAAPEPVSAALHTEAVFTLGEQPPRDGGQPDHLILGDNYRVMSALLEAYEGKINLIYADPPFFTNRGYRTRVGRGEDSRQPAEWELAEGYADQWEDLDHYLDMLYPRLRLMHRLLSPTGSLYLHLDWHANSYARILLDEIFGYDRLNNEIIWTYHGPSPIRSAFNRKHDTILFYTKSDEYTFNVDDVRVPYSDSTVETFNSSPKAGFGKVPDLKRGKVPEDWWYFPVVARLHSERTGYPTQKPESLLERVIRASSNPGDLVADFFCGSGTTPVVASRLGRKFIASDAQWRAIQITRSRFVQDDLRQEGDPRDVRFLMQREERVPAPVYESGKWASRAGNQVVLEEDILPEVDYWEIDPDWREGCFHSRLQAARPRRDGLIAASLSLPEEGEQICVRVLLVDGTRYQQVLAP